MPKPDKSSGVDRGRNRGPKLPDCEPYNLRSAPRSVSRASNASCFTENSDGGVQLGKRRREASPTTSHIPPREESSSPQHATPRLTPFSQFPSVSTPIPPIPPLPSARSWADDVDTPYSLGEDFRAKIDERFRVGFHIPEAGVGKGTVLQQYLERAFDALADAVAPYLDDINTRAENIDNNLQAITSSTERFLHKAKGWQKARAHPDFAFDVDEPPNHPNPPPSSSDNDISQKIDQLFKTLGNLGNRVEGTVRSLESKVDRAISGVNNLNNRVGQLEKPSGQQPQPSNNTPSTSSSNSPPSPSKAPGTSLGPGVTSQPPTLAQIVAAAPNPAQGTPNGAARHSSNPQKNAFANNSSKKSKSLRFVFRFEGGGLPPELRLAPHLIKQKITSVMDTHDCFKHTVLQMVVWNAYGNLILEFAPGANPQHILQAGDQFKDSIRFSKPCTFSRATNWSKVMLSHVVTGYISMIGNGTVFSSERLLDEFKYSNRDFADLVFMQQPSWVKSPATIQTFKSSISFAFEDADGSKLQKLLKTPLFMFGSRVYAYKWNAKPLLRCCMKCHDYGHDGKRCNKTARCLHCGGAHPTESHREKCSLCNPKRGEGTPFGSPCPHPKRCHACNGLEGHAFNDPDCPKKAQYRTPSFNSSRADASGSQHDMSDE